jgi:hypothetical protein
VDIKETGHEDANWIKLADDSDQNEALVETEMNRQVP